MSETQHIKTLTLDEASITTRTPELERERSIALKDLTRWNHFAVKDAEGPYNVVLGTSENRIKLTVQSEFLAVPLKIAIPLSPFRSIIRDYFLICETYFEAVRAGNLPRIEAIDMTRRGLHNEGADLLVSLLADKVDIDSETARRLFTLITVLHLK